MWPYLTLVPSKVHILHPKHIYKVGPEPILTNWSWGAPINTWVAGVTVTTLLIGVISPQDITGSGAHLLPTLKWNDFIPPLEGERPPSITFNFRQQLTLVVWWLLVFFVPGTHVLWFHDNPCPSSRSLALTGSNCKFLWFLPTLSKTNMFAPENRQRPNLPSVNS